MFFEANQDIMLIGIIQAVLRLLPFPHPRLGQAAIRWTYLLFLTKHPMEAALGSGYNRQRPS